MNQPAMAERHHPRGLYLLFTVEMWERFSYYGMRAILVLYMTKALLFTTQMSGNVYGWYTGLVYLTPLLGGYLADRYLGQRRCVTIGAIVMALGEFSLAASAFITGNPAPVITATAAGPTTSFAGLAFFYVGLVLLIVGNGFFKPNISTTVGKLYEQNDPRRDGAFTIFYMGINLGAFFSPLVCGTLGEKLGWQWGFFAAGIGMVAGLLVLKWGEHQYLGEVGLHPVHAKKADGTVDKHAPLTTEEKHRIAVIFILVFFVIFFWASFEQAGSSLTLFAEHSTDRMISFLNWEFPTSWFQSVNPMLIFILAPLFSVMWIRLAVAGKDPSTPFKMALGLALLALGFVLMVVAGGIVDTNGGGRVGLWWLLGAYFLMTLGELCLSPIGLSMVTKLSPLRFTSLLMGVWFLSSFAANLVGGIFAGNYDAMSKATFFMIPVATAGGAALLLFILAKPLKKWMHGVN
jgi:POT family proton-dependent oligopeptide transporter